MREVALHAVAIASAYAADLGCWEELMLVHRLLERGNGAARQRANAAEGGVELMLQRLVRGDRQHRYGSLEAVAAVGVAPRMNVADKARDALSKVRSGPLEASRTLPIRAERDEIERVWTSRTATIMDGIPFETATTQYGQDVGDWGSRSPCTCVCGRRCRTWRPTRWPARPSGV